MIDLESALGNDLRAVVLFIPNLVGAALTLLIGWLVAIVVERALTAGLARVGFDHLAGRTGMIEDLGRVGIRAGPSRLIGRLAFWIVLAATLVQALGALDLATISQSLALFVGFLPHVVLAIAIALAGIVIGDMLGRTVGSALARAGILYHDLAGAFARGAIVVIALLMALQQLTIDSAFLFELFLVAFGALALAFALASGLGARNFAENVVSGRYLERLLTVGDRIAVAGRTGAVERIEPLCTIVRAADGSRIVYPNSVLTNAVIEIAAEE